MSAADAARHQRIRAVFVEACDLHGAAREAAVERGCGGDETLRAEVLRLLRRDAPEDDLLADEAVDAGAALVTAGGTLPPAGAGPAADWLPPEIGGYRIIRRIGVGGMGTVYEAEQRDPRRVVALKTMQRWSASPSLIRRFRHEAQVLGRLQHPGIAQIFEASVHSPGDGEAAIPFFVMELIRGQPATAFVRQRRLAVADRLELFIRICDAVAYAHQHGVIHRDLKPDNILVDDAGQPKILDFGIAKSVRSELDAAATGTLTLHTAAGQFVGTLPYMSPEQVGGDPSSVDSRSDVYALGVVLYQMLTDRLPYEVGDRPLPEAIRVIREENHTRLSDVDRGLRGDLETIIAKALEKEAARRYQSVTELAQDIRRHLDHQPIAARPPSTFYQLSKFAHRNKVLVGGVLGVFVALILGVVGTTIFALDAAASARAARESERAQRWSHYLARIDSAAAALDRQDVVAARRHLELAPAEHRGWEWRHLERALKRWAVEISCDSEVVGTVSFMPGDDRVMATLTGADGRPDRICAWEIRSGLQIRSIDLPAPVKVVADAAAGPLMAVATTDGAVLVVDVEAGSVIDRWEAAAERGGDEVSALAIGPDGALIAIGTPTGVLAWDRSRRQVAWRHDLDVGDPPTPAAAKGLAHLTIAADGSLVAASQRREQNRFHTWTWDARTGAARGPIRGETSRAVAVRPGPASSTRPPAEAGSPAVAGSPAEAGPADSDGTPPQRDLAMGSMVRDMVVVNSAAPRSRRTLTGHTGSVRHITYSIDGTRVASESNDGTIRIRRADDDATIAVLVDPQRPWGDGGASFSADGTRLASHAGRTIRVWNVEESSSMVLRGHRSYVYEAVFSPDGSMLASHTFGEGAIRLWDAADGGAIARLPGLVKPTGLRFSPDGSAIEARNGRRVRTCDTATGVATEREVASPAAPRSVEGPAASTPTPAPRTLAVEVDPSGRMEARLARRSGGQDDKETDVSLSWLDGTSGPMLLTHESGARSASFSPDSALLAIGCEDGRIVVWRTADGTRLATLSGHADLVYSVAFSPDGRRLASGSNDCSLRLWDTATWDQVLERHDHTSYIHSVNFSPDGSQIATASGDGTVRLWDSVDKSVRLADARAADALRREMRPQVLAQLEAFGAAASAAAFRSNPSLDEGQRRAALRELLVAAVNREEPEAPVRSVVSTDAASTSLDPTDAALEAALELAGDNRSEIERFLDRYDFDGGRAPDADPEKRIAARWLVANMPGQGYARVGLVDAQGNEIPFDAAEHASAEAAQARLDVLEQEHGALQFRTLSVTPDLAAITAEQLERNHELAFDAWRTAPWGRSIDFPSFLAHILPHRGSHEALDPTWRDAALARIQPTLQDLQEGLGHSPLLEEAAAAVTRAARPWVRFRQLYYFHPTDQNWTQMCESRAGRCEDQSNMALFAARAAAVLVACDSVTFWADSDNNHAWDVRLDTSGRGTGRLAHRAAKVHRRTYAPQPRSLALAKDPEEPAPPWLSGSNSLDVTAEYMPVSDVDVELGGSPHATRIAYLCVFNAGQWRPVHWSQAERQDGDVEGAFRARFDDMGRQILYLPAWFTEEGVVPAGPPMLLLPDGGRRPLVPAQQAFETFTLELEARAAPANSSARAAARAARRARRDGARAEPDADRDARAGVRIDATPGVAQELLVWDVGDGAWRSLGTATAEPGRPARLEDVPAGGLYWLRDPAGRGLERPFTVEDGLVVGW